MNSAPLDPNSVKDVVRHELDARQKALLQEVAAEIEHALKSNQKLTVLTGQQKDEKKSHWWDVAQIVITALVGVFVFLTQNSLSNQLAATSLGISTRYTLTQEYYKERFKTYQQTYQRLAELQDKFMILQRDNRATQDAISAKDDLDNEIGQSELYYSPDILKMLNEISYLATQIPPVNSKGNHRIGELKKEIQTAKTAMYQEVTAGDIGSLQSTSKRKLFGRFLCQD